MEESISKSSPENENLNQSTSKKEASINPTDNSSNKESKLDKHKIALWCAWGGGVILFILHLTTKGEIPGGFKMGVAGGIVGYGLAWLVLAFIPSKKK